MRQSVTFFRSYLTMVISSLCESVPPGLYSSVEDWHIMSALHSCDLLNVILYCLFYMYMIIYEPRHEIFNNVVCATSKASDQPAHTRSLIRSFASRLNIL